MDTALLQTKLYTPPIRAKLVSRHRLTTKLNSGLAGKLTLVSAPAGFGKTTAVLDFLAQLENTRASWFSIDEQDNDPARFLAYFVAAIQALMPGMGDEVAKALQSPQPPPFAVILTPLINGLAASKNQLLLVLDDYHFIETPAIHKILAFLLEHQPVTLHLVLITRADPLLPLARLRARGELMEIREDELRFTQDETAYLLNQIMGRTLTLAQLRTLEKQTEGWAAGLQLAALSMQGQENVDQFLASFSGTHRFILDYLADEVLQQRPKGTQDFLLKTSILDRLHGPLCDAVTGQTNGQAVLEQLDQANLFIFPLDGSRQWFRYHRLFVELLQQRLRAFNEEPTAVLHERASRWYEKNGFLTDAIHHAVAGEDWPRTAVLLGQAADGMLKRGQLVTLIGWFEQLPETIIRSQPPLGMSFAWALLLVGQFEKAGELLAFYEEIGQNVPELLGQVLAAQAYLARSLGNNDLVVEKSEQALKLLPTDDYVSRGTVSMNLGLVYWHQGRLHAAVAPLTQAREIARLGGNRYGELTSQLFLARTLASQGQLRQAQPIMAQVVADGGRVPIVALAHYDLAALHLEWHEFDQAQTQLDLGMTLSRNSHNVEFLNAGHLQNALFLAAMQDFEAAWQAVEAAQKLSTDLNLVTQARCTAVLGEVALAAGDVETAVRLANDLNQHVDAHSLYRFLGLTWIKVLLAQGHKEAAARELTACYDRAHRFGWGYGLLATRVLQALSAPDKDTAETILLDTLRLAEPEGYIHTIAEGGKPMAALLQSVAAQGQQRAYIGKILAAMNASGMPEKRQAMSELIEPLSERELDILHLLEARQTNAEIAASLMVSVNTVKTHLQHIYEKLGVHSRKTAVTRANELHLL